MIYYIYMLLKLISTVRNIRSARSNPSKFATEFGTDAALGRVSTLFIVPSVWLAVCALLLVTAFWFSGWWICIVFAILIWIVIVIVHLLHSYVYNSIQRITQKTVVFVSETLTNKKQH